MKSLRRHGETLNIDMHLQLNRHTEQEWPTPFLVPSPYNCIGHGRDTLVREAFISRPSSAMRNEPQTFTIAESMASSGYLRKQPEEVQAPPFSGINPTWENSAGFSTPEFGLLVSKQATINQTIDPGYLLLRASTPSNQTIYQALN